MDLIVKNPGVVTPTKDPHSNRSRTPHAPKYSENSNPNAASPNLKCPNSPAAIKSGMKSHSQRSLLKNHPSPINPVGFPTPGKKIRGRKFVVAKKNSNRGDKATSAAAGVNCKCKIGGKSQKCLCVAYESLRASQEEFFKNRSESEKLNNLDRADTVLEEDAEENPNPNLVVNGSESEEGEDDCYVCNEFDGNQTDASGGGKGSSNIKRRRDKLMEQARESLPEAGAGRVMHLVQAFEKLLSIPKAMDSDQTDEMQSEDMKKETKWALPGLPPPPKVPDEDETRVSASSLCPSDLFLTPECLGLDSRSCSLDSSQGRASDGGSRSRRNSGSSGTFAGRRWKRRQLKGTRLRPFELRTERRGRCKEEEFIKKVQQMMTEEAKQRVPIAQGLPWTTDEPECLVKPPVKEPTRPVDLVLHSDVRAVERAEFDHQMAEKMSLIEQYRMERERQQKLAEEEELRRLRKELIPKAQPMPYFDRPFIPRRSSRHPTIPKEPKFHHIPEHKKIKCCMSWNDMCPHQQ